MLAKLVYDISFFAEGRSFLLLATVLCVGRSVLLAGLRFLWSRVYKEVNYASSRRHTPSAAKK